MPGRTLAASPTRRPEPPPAAARPRPTGAAAWGRRLCLAVTGLLACGVAARAAENVKITTTDGRTLAGELRTRRDSKTLAVRDGLRDVYLSAKIVKSIGPAPAVADVTYTLGENLKRVESTPKKGTVGLVMRSFAFTKHFDETGTATVAVRDPKLGDISFTVLLTRLTPQTYEFQGVEYRKKLGFPCRFPNPFWKRMVFKHIDLDNQPSLVKGIRFFRLTSDRRTTEELIAALAKLSPAAATAERAAIEVDAVRRALRQAESMEFRGLYRRAADRLRPIRMSAAARALAGDVKAQLDARITRLKGIAKTLTEAEGALAAAGLGGRTLTLGQARRVLKAVGKGVTGREKLTKGDLETFCRPWSEALLEAKTLTPETLATAEALAEATAAYFAGPTPEDTGALAGRFADPTLPMAVKLAIFREARPSAAETPAASGTIRFTHPVSGEEFHYVLTLPPGYDPSRPAPALICMHGQLSKAGSMTPFWRSTAAANGMILIDPEYVYGRRWGYRYSQQEHDAVLGALQDAAGRCNIDTDRVYLSGHSQGGHASWDLGAAHAGRFAGVLPVIGAPMFHGALPNYLDTALYSIDGSLDGAAPERNRKAVQLLGVLGVDCTYVEYIGREHESFSEERDEAALWMLRHRRDPAPRQLRLIAQRPCDFRRRWVEIRTTHEPIGIRWIGKRVILRPAPKTAEVSASVAGNRFTIRTKNVATMRILLSPNVIDFSRKVTLLLNGRYIPPRAVTPDWAFALADSLARRDRREVHLGEIALTIRKR